MLPDVDSVVIILSGGMDSTIAMRLCVEKYGPNNVKALTFNYGQKQKIEIEKAKESTALLNVEHKVIDALFLNDISIGFSANVDPNINMPTIKEVLGDPTPKTYVPNRNMILLSIAAAYAETKNINTVICGLQTTDSYSYHDTTPEFIDKINNVLNENRKIKIKICAPFNNITKTRELELLNEIDGNFDLLKHSITCYNPNKEGKSCGNCPSCSERIKAFINLNAKDPIEYV